MKYLTKRKIIVFIIFVLLIAFIAIAFETLVGENIGEISINPVNGNVAIQVFSDYYSKIEVLDDDLNIIRSINLNEIFYIPNICSYSRDGSKFYVCIADMSATGFEVDYQEFAKFLVIDTNTWQESYYDLPLYAMQMYVPLQNNIVYIACGFDNEPKLLKIDTTSGQILNTISNYGHPECAGLTMNHDETKIYIHGRKVRTIEFDCPSKTKSEVLIYDTDFNFIKDILIAPDLVDMINGPGDKIYIAHANYHDFDECANSGICISVLDTVNDEIIYEFGIPDIAARKLAHDPLRNYLYISPLTPQKIYDEEFERYFTELHPINSVIKVDLSVWSYTWINVADETIGPIALSPDGTRLYAAAVNTDSKKVYYVDLE